MKKSILEPKLNNFASIFIHIISFIVLVEQTYYTSGDLIILNVNV